MRAVGSYFEKPKVEEDELQESKEGEALLNITMHPPRLNMNMCQTRVNNSNKHIMLVTTQGFWQLN